MRRIGFVVNPVAGIGGKVGLKGSDGEAVVRRALELGAVMESGQKSLIAALKLKEVEEQITLYTCPGRMGADVCEAAGLAYTVLGEVTDREDAAGCGACSEEKLEEPAPDVMAADRYTTSRDTVCAVRRFLEAGAEFILFAGGDGTARDIMDAVGVEIPVLGIPTGCKIHSGVYALNPRRAGELAVRYICGKVHQTKEAEVMDIDEEEFRKGRVQSRLYGYLRIPDDVRLVQNLKSGSARSEQDSIERLSEYIVDHWESDTLYIVGGGSTTACIMKKKNLPNTLLGIDLVYENQVVAADCTEREILEIMKEYPRVKILVTVIGGQGYIFGRGNQQISAGVIRRAGRENIIVAASADKMLNFVGKSLYADTGDEEVNRYMTGYIRVIVGYGDYVVIRVK